MMFINQYISLRCNQRAVTAKTNQRDNPMRLFSSWCNFYFNNFLKPLWFPHHLGRLYDKSLYVAETEKECNYLDSCLHQWRHFLPFFVSVDGLFGTEVDALMRCLAIRLVTKWRQPYEHTFGYVQSRVVITMVRATHCCIQGYQVP